MKKISSPNLAKCYHFVIILLSSSGFLEFVTNPVTPYNV